MLKLRLGFAVAAMALLSGCPEPADDMRRARGEAGDPQVAAIVEADEYACSNHRRWREDLDLPEWLKTASTDPNADDAKRERLRKEYLKDHEGTYTTCRLQLEKDTGSNRGTCPTCTGMLKDPKFMVQRTSAKEVPETNPVEIPDEQLLLTKVEFRLKPQDADYVKDPAEQEKCYREWLGTRKLGPILINGQIEQDVGKVTDHYVEREKVKGSWTTNPQSPKQLLRYGLPPLADPLVRCPSCKKSVGLHESRCWNCNNFYTVLPRDARVSVNEPFEAICPSCRQPVDPTTNFCSNSKCDRFFRAVDREGPCWRCGGMRVCPECGGSGKGTAPILGGDDCYVCSGNKQLGLAVGNCPECDSRGFTTYDGTVPVTFKGDKRKKDDWRLPKAGGAAAGTPPAGPKDDKPEKEMPPEKEGK